MESLSMRLMPVFDWLLRTTLQAALLFCLIMLIKLVVGGRLPIRWHYCLWLLLLVRLATPWLPESRISIFNWAPQSIQHGGIIKSLSQPRDARGMGFYMRGGIQDPQEAESKAAIVKFARILPLLWLAGGVALAVYVGASNFRLWWLVTRERPLTDQKILDLLEDCKAEMGIRNILGIVTTDKVKSAALFGFLRPRLLLPAGMVESLSRQELRYVFMHELGHLRRRDIYVGWLMSLLQVLHWFNPFVWLAFYRMQSDRELACDALVLSYARSGEHKEYGRTIVNLLERFSRPQRLPSMAGISENKSQLKRRIKMIAKFRKTSRARWTGAMLLLVALACIVLTNSYVAKAEFGFGTPVNLGPAINSAVHEAGAAIAPDGLSLYFWRGADWQLAGDAWLATRATKQDLWDSPVSLGAWDITSIYKSVKTWAGLTTADGLELYSTDESLAAPRSGGYGGLDLWAMKRTAIGTDWGSLTNLGPVVNSSNHDFATCISSDGLELYFSSNRPGGSGDVDLWVTKRATREHPWTVPVNLGPVVNSAAHDARPWLSTDGLVLLFDSDRSGGYGEADIYETRRATLTSPWGAPMNLGPIVNSPGWEECAYMSADGSTLFFDCERPGGYGGHDIWQVSIVPVVDLNGDGKVDVADVSIMVEHWHTDDPACDIGPMPWGDGFVDAQDLAVLAGYLSEGTRPTAHWKLDEDQGGIAYDSAGVQDADLHGGPVWQPSGGKEGGALLLDGANDYISTPFILDPAAGSFSVFAWIKSNARGQVIISQNGATGARWLWTDPSYGRLTSWLMHPPFDPLMSGSTIADGQWRHVGMVYDAVGLKRYLYVDGVEVAKDADYAGGVGSDGGLYFGADRTLQPGTFFSGLIDDVRIYDKTLSADEVVELAK